MENLEGYISHIRFHNEENGYTVLELETTHGDEILVGYFHYIDEGEYISAECEFKDHPIHGPQYEMRSYTIKKPDNKEAMERYLSSGAIKGIGPALAKRIIRKFKGEAFEIMEKEPERLAEVKGISLKKAMDMAIQFQEKQDMRQAMMFLSEYGISSHFAVKIYEEYGERLYDVLRNNPYRLAEDIHGIGFKAADAIAAKAGIAPDSEFRICAAMLYILQQAALSGHLYLPKHIFIRNVEHLLGLASPDLENPLLELVISRKLMIRMVEGEEHISLGAFYVMEENVASMLHEINVDFPQEPERLDKILESVSEESSVVMDEQQVEAVRKAFLKGLVVITGGPGTGKTTTINQMIGCFEKEDLEIALAAPTGRAAKRMTEATGYEAKTIHRLLELSGGIEGSSSYSFERNKDNPLEADVVILDEMSMVDIQLMNALLNAIIPGTRLILVGDADQLPSVGPGNVLRDIIASNEFSVVRLTKIYRQEETSHIVMNAHKINRGESIDLNSHSKDFYFFQKEEIRSAIGALIYLVQTKIPEYAGVKPFDVQVLAPMRKGELGVGHLNELLQYYLNPASPEKKEHEVHNVVFREGDKVMQIRNNYKLEWRIKSANGFHLEEGQGIFNGDLGEVKTINTFSETMTVLFDENKEVEYSFSNLDELELAYAITIHKSQGSEYPAIVIPLLSGPPVLCNRNLLYTAVTRAQKCAVIVGRTEMVEQMIRNETEQKRYSDLAYCLKNTLFPGDADTD